MVSLRDVPLSGDSLTDWIFKQFIFYLRKETIHIKRKRKLLDPNNKHKKTIRGLMEPKSVSSEGNIEITINSSLHCDRNEEVETLIHELGHVVFWTTPEWSIKSLEGILIKKFTPEQKSFLKSFIPRHEVKN